MKILPICTRADYERALRELSVYFNDEPEPGSEAGNRFEILANLVEAYEMEHFAIGAPDPARSSSL